MAKTSYPPFSLGHRLRFARLNADLTQREVSARANIHPRNYSRYELGDIFPPPDVLANLCRALGVSSDFILGLTDEFSPKESGHDYICIMESDGVRYMYNIPAQDRSRVSAMLHAVFPEIMEHGAKLK